MEKQKRDRILGVVIHDGNILLIKRITTDETFYGFPGGGMESGETPEETVIREVKEETNIDAKNPTKLFEIEHPELGTSYFFLVTDIDIHDLKLTGPELQDASETNQYIPCWVPLSDFEQITVYPKVAIPQACAALKERGLL